MSRIVDAVGMTFLYVMTAFLLVRYARAMSSSIQGNEVKKIFCYGDSLTAGTVANTPILHPYGPFLEQNLKLLNPNMNVAVRWRGFPGWTAQQLAQEKDVDGVGLRDALLKHKASNSDASLVVILAGTNDLGYAFQMNKDVEESSREISNSVISLHEIAHDEGIPTIAISIPDSGFQHQASAARQIASRTNEIIEEWCLQNCDAASFVEFPFGWNKDDSRWSVDGLHLSEEGYFELAKSIAPIVYMNGCS